MTKLKMKKYLTLLSLITILIAAPLTTPIAFADNNDERRGQSEDHGDEDDDRRGQSEDHGDEDDDRRGQSEDHGDEASASDNSEPTSITANVTGLVTDLGVQKYTINGKGGLVDHIGNNIVTKQKIELKLKATVMNAVVTGSLKLNITGESESGKIELKVDIPIISGDPGYGCLDGTTQELIVCPEEKPWDSNIVPFLELENGDFIPIFFTGIGDATLKIGKETTTYPVSVVIDTSTAQHPFKGGPFENTGQVGIADTYGLFALSVDVTKFDVEYTAIQLAGEVTGNLTGIMLQIANADEDHVKDIEKDYGDIVFQVNYNGEMIQMTGSYEGNSVQSEYLDYLYISTGTFTTSDGMKIKGEYVTIWTLPLFFESTFTGTVK